MVRTESFLGKAIERVRTRRTGMTRDDARQLLASRSSRERDALEQVEERITAQIPEVMNGGGILPIVDKLELTAEDRVRPPRFSDLWRRRDDIY